MKDFKENNCRLCKKVLCCKICREKHESKQHKIFPGCDICLTGKTLISCMIISDNLISHTKECHLPLHCIFCRRFFGSVDKLFQHTKCPLVNKFVDSPNTTDQSNSSPYFFQKNYKKNLGGLKSITNLATSTPMQQSECIKAFKKTPEVITPVDYCSEPKKVLVDSSSSYSTSSKRKVTFWDTPVTESFSKKSKNSITSTPGSKYYTASEDIMEEMNEKQRENSLVPCIKIESPSVVIKELDDNPVVTKELEENGNVKDENGGNINEISRDTSRVILKEEQTIWISAYNISTTEICADLSMHGTPDSFIPNNNFVTPFVPKANGFITPSVPKGRKIRVDSPLVKNNAEVSWKFDGPVQISSTPNSSIIPIKSAPHIKDIFRNSDQMPSTSKSDMENWSPAENYNSGGLSSNGSVAGTSTINNVSMPNKLWTSVSKMVKNVLQGFSNSFDTAHSAQRRSLKRHCSDTDVLEESPLAKRFKLTDIKCRRNIRDMTPLDKYLEACRKARARQFRLNIINSFTRTTTKTFADKATQTDE